MKSHTTAKASKVYSRQRNLSTAHPTTGKSVLYVMSRDQRARDNHALYLAQQQALELKLPLIVAFNLLPRVGVRAREHYQFMLDGLEQVAHDLRQLGISFVMVSGDPVATLPQLCQQLQPAHVYFDFSPMFGVRKTQARIADVLNVPCSVVDTHNVIPAWVVSDKQEFAAHTIRRKIHKHLETYLVGPEQVQKHPYESSIKVESLSFEEARQIVSKVPACGITHGFEPGEHAAVAHLKSFIQNDLHNYANARNDIANDGQSGLSPYLHFGQISSLRVAIEVLAVTNTVPLLFQEPRMASAGDGPRAEDGMNALFEEMIVRKELADNFCMYVEDASSVYAAPNWAKETLGAHAHDLREHMYNLEELESAKTHDDIWNAAQLQLTKTGKMHGYMRMYWAKKILEWTPDAQTAINYAVYLNDHYSLDGGDPNGYVGILWSMAGLHDRPWLERPIFGKVRYMNAAGLQRKFDADAYIAKWNPAK